MARTIALYYSSGEEAGNTARLLRAFLGGMERGGDVVQSFAIMTMSILPCTGELACWSRTPGHCYIQDDMQRLYPLLRAAQTLVLATPVYIPLPGQMQNVLNRLCPLLDPELQTREGRTRARLRQDVAIRRIALVATSGWWEIENLDTVVRVARELAEDASVSFVGALLRPHADAALRPGRIAEEILGAADQAGFELATHGLISTSTLAAVSRPVLSREEYFRYEA
ncbi:MAG: flavodoxin family protein [Candidatus Bipolaricaulis sp.]|nr:flavodoxin family protein [Candidatus Bipolaricaulis sp.]